jgi:hypothetical protein
MFYSREQEEQPNCDFVNYFAQPAARLLFPFNLGARWDAVKKAWYVGPEADRERIGKWEPKHQPAPTPEFVRIFASLRKKCPSSPLQA